MSQRPEFFYRTAAKYMYVNDISLKKVSRVIPIVNCSIYKSNKKTDYYLFVEQEDNFERVPESLLKMLGILELVMTINLDDRKKLSQANPAEVKQLLVEQGYFLQLPAHHYRAGQA